VSGQRIDVHTHAMPERAMAAIAPQGFRPRGGYKISVQWTPEAALAYMDRRDIAAQIVSMPMAFAGTPDDPEFGTRIARMINDGSAELIEKHPDRFGAFATLPSDGPDQALAELTHALDELRLDGVVLTSNMAGRYFGDPALEPVLAELARRQVPVFVHPTDCPYIDVLGFGRPSSIVEFPFDTARTITNAIYTGVFQQMVKAVTLFCLHVFNQRIGKTAHMPARFPYFGIH